MDKNFLLSVFLIACSYSGLQAQSHEHPLKENIYQVGVAYSTLGGAGIYVMLPGSSKDHIKLTGIFIYSKDDTDKESYFSLGAEYQRDLLQNPKKRGYFALGSHIDNELTENMYYQDEGKVSFFNMGAGLGLDIGDRRKGLILNLHISYQLTTGLAGSDETRVGLGGGVGLGFNF